MHSPPSKQDRPNAKTARARCASAAEKQIANRARPRRPLETHTHNRADVSHPTANTRLIVSLMACNKQKEVIITCTVQISTAGLDNDEAAQSTRSAIRGILKGSPAPGSPKRRLLRSISFLKSIR